MIGYILGIVLLIVCVLCVLFPFYAAIPFGNWRMILISTFAISGVLTAFIVWFFKAKGDSE